MSASTEQVLREALHGMVALFRGSGSRHTEATQQAFDAARAALALPDSGDHTLAVAWRNASADSFDGPSRLPPCGILDCNCETLLPSSAEHDATGGRVLDAAPSDASGPAPQPNVLTQVQRLLDEEIEVCDVSAASNRRALKSAFRDRVHPGYAAELAHALAALGERRMAFLLLKQKIQALRKEHT